MENKFKIGDRVRIVNLEGGLHGIIGHIGYVTDISKMGYYYLTPFCKGACWREMNLELYKEYKI